MLPPATVLALGVAGVVAPTAEGPVSTEASIDSPAAVPPVSTVPFETPASQTRLIVRRGPGLAATPAAAHGVALDIPAPALAAYQRAEAVMDDAHPICRLPWELLAAIGRVESDHGRHGSSGLDTSGRARPAIIGIRLDGRGPVAAIRDTDAGGHDGDVRWDRAVGPMQFIPSTWAVVGVDADGDGKRDPQDIDDAALAAAVYLCAGNRDLAREADREAAVHSYNHDDAYVALVLRIFESYVAAGALAGTPTGTVVVHAAVAVQTRTQHTGSNSGPRNNAPPRPPDPPASAPDESAEPTPGPVTEPPEEPAAEEPPSTDPSPTEPPTTDPPSTDPAPTEPPTCEPTQSPTEEPPVEEPTGEPTAEPPPVEESTEPPVPPDGEGEVGCGTTTEPEPTLSSTP